MKIENHLERRYKSKVYEDHGVRVTIPRVKESGGKYIIYFQVEYLDLADGDGKIDYVIKLMTALEAETKKYYGVKGEVHFKDGHTKWLADAQKKYNSKEDIKEAIDGEVSS
jgi:hypothetical protein